MKKTVLEPQGRDAGKLAEFTPSVPFDRSVSVRIPQGYTAYLLTDPTDGRPPIPVMGGGLVKVRDLIGRSLGRVGSEFRVAFVRNEGPELILWGVGNVPIRHERSGRSFCVGVNGRCHVTVRDPDKFFHHFGTRMPITVDRIRDALLPTVRRIGPGILTDHFPGSDTPPDADAAGHLAELSRLFDDALRKQTVFEELGIDPGEITVAGIRADEEKTDARREGDAKEIFRCNIDGVLELTCSFGENETCGTGFFVGVDGYLLTNAHVVISRDEKGRMMAAGQIICSSVHSGLTASADVIYADGAHDLALLLVGTAPGKVLKLAKEPPEIGDRVFAIGNNRGEGLTFLDGIVGDVDREFNGCPSFMFNALVSTGCSGGPVFNGSGEVCGMTVGQLSDTPGMNYAIPAGILSAFLQKAGKARGIPEWEKI